MDGAIFYQAVAPEEGYEAIKRHVEQAFGIGGCVVFDWHMEQLNPKRLSGAGPVFAKVLLELAEDSNIFWACPSQLTDWWQDRQRRLALQSPQVAI
jgi:hypothetical protein